MPETAEEKKDKTEAAKGPVDIKNMDTKQKAAIVVVSLGLTGLPRFINI